MLVHEGKFRHARELGAERYGMGRSVGHQIAVYVDPLMHKKHHVGALFVMSERLVVWAGLCGVEWCLEFTRSGYGILHRLVGSALTPP